MLLGLTVLPCRSGRTSDPYLCDQERSTGEAWIKSHASLFHLGEHHYLGPSESEEVIYEDLCTNQESKGEGRKYKGEEVYQQ